MVLTEMYQYLSGLVLWWTSSVSAPPGWPWTLMVMTYPKSSTPTPPRDQWPTSENRSCDVLLGLLPSLGEDWQWCHVCCEHQVCRRRSHKSYFLFISCIPCPLHPWYRFRLNQHNFLPFQARALRALGLLLADGAPTVGGGKTFWQVSQIFLRKQL